MRPSFLHRIAVGFLPMAALALAGCGSVVRQGAGSPVPPHQAAATVMADPTQPEMVYFKITDKGYHAYDIPATLGRPVMFMVVNHGTRAHELHAHVPMTTLQVFDPYATTQQPIVPASTLFDVTVQPAHEIDVIFTPAQAGTFPLAGDTMSGGAVVVG